MKRLFIVAAFAAFVLAGCNGAGTAATEQVSDSTATACDTLAPDTTATAEVVADTIRDDE